jgi:GNAT superfamily N-acetyltransferase
MTSPGKRAQRPPGSPQPPVAYPLRPRMFRCDRWRAEALREDLADLYVESVQVLPGAEYRSREEFLARLADNVRQPGFSMTVAEATNLQGCAYGFPISRDGSWWHGIDGTLPQYLEQLTASGHIFALTEIMVHPDDRDHGLAQQLQELLLAEQHASLGVALVDENDRAAYESFQSWGWQEIGEVRRPTGPPVLRAMARTLGERTALHPDGLAHDAHTQRPESAGEDSRPRTASRTAPSSLDARPADTTATETEHI